MNKDLKYDEIVLVNKALRVFTANDWPIHSLELPRKSSFEYYCEMLKPLNQQEVDLIIDLTLRFRKVRHKEYADFLIEVINKIPSTSLKENILIVPLIKPNDFANIKSGDHIAYLCNIGEVKYETQFADKNVKITKPKKIKSKFIPDKTTVVFIDDFIGTGDTAKGAIEYIMDNQDVPISDIIVITLAIMKVGFELLCKKGIQVEYNILLEKGISDYYKSPEIIGRHLETMNNIEKRMKIEEMYSFGYGKSEGLISLIRTPNNTFPIFWASEPDYRNTALFPRLKL